MSEAPHSRFVSEGEGDALTDAWQGWLMPGERILWQGRPVSAKGISAEDRTAGTVGVAFTAVGLALLGLVLAGKFSDKSNGALLGLVGAGVCLPFGLFLFIGIPLWRRYRRNCSTYTLTNRRAIIGSGLFGLRGMTSYTLQPGFQLQRTPHGETLWIRGSYTPGASAPARGAGFENIEDGAAVFALVEKALKEAP
ncbi:hypothetical protein [Vannielia litorea]|uniref:hypothetical protein n=1 Tax=Vannielia litorea TaxID=1217970 RepID=UPI001BD022C5|nr:hypothetical protein [Vannielia litorea]MBS8228382.1 hypothetical protein [Vannielia litorea]